MLLKERRVGRSEVRCCMSGSIVKTNDKEFRPDRGKEDRIAGIIFGDGYSIQLLVEGEERRKWRMDLRRKGPRRGE